MNNMFKYIAVSLVVLSANINNVYSTQQGNDDIPSIQDDDIGTEDLLDDILVDPVENTDDKQEIKVIKQNNNPTEELYTIFGLTKDESDIVNSFVTTKIDNDVSGMVYNYLYNGTDENKVLDWSDIHKKLLKNYTISLYKDSKNKIISETNGEGLSKLLFESIEKLKTEYFRAKAPIIFKMLLGNDKIIDLLNDYNKKNNGKYDSVSLQELGKLISDEKSSMIQAYGNNIQNILDKITIYDSASYNNEWNKLIQSVSDVICNKLQEIPSIKANDKPEVKKPQSPKNKSPIKKVSPKKRVIKPKVNKPKTNTSTPKKTPVKRIVKTKKN